MKGCYKYDCLNHDRGKPFNCWEYDMVTTQAGLCGQYVSAESLMRTFSPGCHKNARGRWVGDKTVVFR